MINLEENQEKGVIAKKGKKKKSKDKEKGLGKSISIKIIETIEIIGITETIEIIEIIEDKISIMIVIGETAKEMIEGTEVRKKTKRSKEKIGIDHVQDKNTQIIDKD